MVHVTGYQIKDNTHTLKSLPNFSLCRSQAHCLGNWLAVVCLIIPIRYPVYRRNPAVPIHGCAWVEPSRSPRQGFEITLSRPPPPPHRPLGGRGRGSPIMTAGFYDCVDGCQSGMGEGRKGRMYIYIATARCSRAAAELLPWPFGPYVAGYQIKDSTHYRRLEGSRYVLTDI